MNGIETDAALFHGVDRGWMQAQWRDCQDKGKQLGIFRDMVGKKATVQEILDAVGDPSYCGPIAAVKRGYKQYTAEDNAKIAAMAAEGKTNREIAEAMGVTESAITWKIVRLKRSGIEIPGRKRGSARNPKAEAAPEITAADPGEGKVPQDIRAEIEEMLRAEEDLTAALTAVRARKKELRESLAEMMDMLGGDGDAE